MEATSEATFVSTELVPIDGISVTTAFVFPVAATSFVESASVLLPNVSAESKIPLSEIIDPDEVELLLEFRVSFPTFDFGREQAVKREQLKTNVYFLFIHTVLQWKV